MTSLEQHIHAIGASQDFDSPSDEEAFQSLFEAYWRRSDVKPTERGSRQSLRLSITDIEGKSRTHFVFTDIAGEIVADLIKDKKAGIDPAVERRLKKAEIIVFFLDLCLDNALREPLVAGQKGDIFASMFAHIDQARRDREEDRARIEQSNVEELVSTADVPQLRLLGALLRKLEELKQTPFPKPIRGVKFILVIPKCDLFVHPNLDINEARDKGLYFLTPAFEFLKQYKVLVDSRNYPQKGFAGMITTPPHRNGASKSGLEVQRGFLKEISNKTRECLINFGSILGAKASEELRSQMSKKVELHLVNRLEGAFGEDNVFFLPVSARGGNTDIADTSGKPPFALQGELGAVAGFNQKLTEYVFLAPILLALSAGAESSSAPSSTPGSSMAR